MNYTLTSKDLLKENWIKVEFEPAYDNVWTKFVDDYMEIEKDYWDEEYDWNDWERICKERNSHEFLINKENLDMLDKFVKDVGDEFFGDVNIVYYVNDEVNTETLMGWGVFKYGDNGWEEVQNNIKNMVI